MDTEFNLISVGDIHQSDRTPKSRCDNYRTTVVEKLDRVRDQAVIHKADAVALTGDVFDKKEPNRNSHGLVRELIHVFKQFPCPVYAAPGNHDLLNDRLDSLPKQPLGVVYQSGALIQLVPEGVVLEKGGLKVKLAATSYNELDPLPECRKVTKGDADVLITVGHFFATPLGGPFFTHTAVSYDQLARTETDVWVLGHIHTDQGVEKRERKWFVNIGSLTRGVLDEDNLTRQVQVGRVCASKVDGAIYVEASAIPLKVAPSEEVFDLDKYRARQTERAAVEAFVQSLETAFSQVSDASSDPRTILKTMNIPDRILQETLRRIELADER